jgi:hypothetical protein
VVLEVKIQEDPLAFTVLQDWVDIIILPVVHQIHTIPTYQVKVLVAKDHLETVVSVNRIDLGLDNFQAVTIHQMQVHQEKLSVLDKEDFLEPTVSQQHVTLVED